MGINMKNLIAALVLGALAFSACSPSAETSTAKNEAAGPYRLVSTEEEMADAPKYQPGSNLKTFLAELLDWSFAPGAPAYAATGGGIMEFKAKYPGLLWEMEEAVGALGSEGHKGALFVAPMLDYSFGSSSTDRTAALAEQNFAIAVIINDLNIDTATVEPAKRAEAIARLRKLEPDYPLAQLGLAKVLSDGPASEKAEAVKIVTSMHMFDDRIFSLMSSILESTELDAEGQKAMRQMFTAFLAAPEKHSGDGYLRTDITRKLARMLETGVGGPKDSDGAARLYTALLKREHPTCAVEEAEALKRLGRPVPASNRSPCDEHGYTQSDNTFNSVAAEMMEDDADAYPSEPAPPVSVDPQPAPAPH